MGTSLVVLICSGYMPLSESIFLLGVINLIIITERYLTVSLTEIQRNQVILLNQRDRDKA